VEDEAWVQELWQVVGKPSVTLNIISAVFAAMYDAA
jgi:hypothetical protein